MRKSVLTSHLVLALGAVAATAPARADVGHRAFANTLLFDDPEVDDQLTVPSLLFQTLDSGSGGGKTREYDLAFGVEKRVTARLSLSLSGGYSFITAAGAKTLSGLGTLELAAKYEAFRDPRHEFIASVGVVRDFGRTGATHVAAAPTGATTPALMVAKGFGDLPFAPLRPLAVSGTFGYAIADKGLKGTAATDDSGPTGIGFNSGLENRWVGGVSVQYSLSYLDADVQQLSLPDWVTGITPLVEIAWSSPASAPSREGTKLVVAPGLAWSSEAWQFGIEALIPLSRASGRTIGAVAQLQIGLGQIVPLLGKPLF